MDFRILGPIEVRAEGRPLFVPGARQRALLAVLLLRAGQPVSRDQVIADLWGERPPDGAAKTVQAVVSRLRRALDGDAERLVSSAAGYRMRLEPGELDLERFQRVCADGRRALAAGRPERAAARLRAGLQEWRGPPLADVAFEPFAAPEIARLEDLRAAAVEDRVEADLAMGRAAELVGELDGLVAAEPLRERLRGQLMLALYRAGRQGEALDVYREGVRVLDAELGLRPGPELDRLQHAILGHDPALLGAPPGEAPPDAEPRRATATILFADLAGAARLRARVGDADADRLREAHHRRLRDVAGAHDATGVKAVGDGLMAAFAAAGAALACAVEMQRAIDREAAHEPSSLELRVGLGAGDVAWAGGDYSGTAVIEAQRLCAAAPAGSILAAEAVRLLAGRAPDAGLDAAGELTLRDLATPVRAWSVRWTPARTVVVPFPAALAFDRGTMFTGREAELAALREAWADARVGHSRGMLVTGEPGIGKTRLAAEIAQYVGEPDSVVLYGRSDDGLAAAAQPFAQALGAYVAACPLDELRVQLGARAGDLGVLLPQLAERLPGVAEPAPVEPDAERLRTLEATVALLEAAGRATPILLVIDDLHWADDLTLLLLRHVLRADAALRLLVVACYRDTEPSRSPLLADVVTGLARQPGVGHIELGPLAEPEVAAMLSHAGRRPALAVRVRDATAGNPLFVGEMLLALGEDQGESTLTPRLRDVVRSRLATLPKGAVEVLAVAAVAGSEFDAGMLDVDVDRALDAIEAAERARLVAPAGSPNRFTFAHALVREAIAGDLPAGRRARLHAGIAHALERASATRAVAASELAVHFDAAGTLVDAATTLRYARAAGEDAAARLAFDVAAQHYERALRAQRRLPEPGPEQRLDLELACGRALSLAGDARADRVLRDVAAAAERAGDGARMSEALLTLRQEYADFVEEDCEMVALLRRGLALLPPGDSPIRARLDAYLAQEAFSSVPDAERRVMVGRALGMARALGEPRALASVLTSHSWIVAGPESVRERLAVADELIAVGRDAGLPYAECDGQQARFLAMVELGDVKAADAALAAAHAAARTTKSQWTVGFLDAARALVAGRLSDAEDAAARSREAARETAAAAVLAESSFVRLVSCIRLVQGRLTEHEPARRAMAERATTVPATFHVARAHAARERGDRAGARDAFAQALAGGLLELPRGPAWAVSIAWAADICAWLEDRATAAALLDLAAPVSHVMTWQYGPIGRGAGLLQALLGQSAPAERSLRAAVALCERMDARAFLAMAQLDLGMLLVPTEEGHALVAQARAAATALGMPGLLQRADGP